MDSKQIIDTLISEEAQLQPLFKKKKAIEYRDLLKFRYFSTLVFLLITTS